MGAADGSAEPPTSGPDPAQSAQAKARLSNLVSRKLDGFQLRTDFWWTRWNQALAIATSMVVIFAALGTTGLADHIVERLLMGVVGGLLAPYAKDFSQALLGLVKR